MIETQKEQYEFHGQIKEKLDKIKLDLIDKKLLYLLSENARYSYTSLAKTLKIKREIVAYRINRMFKEDFLHGFFTYINTAKLGYELNMVYIKFYNLENYKEIINQVYNTKEITRIKDCAGDYDLQIIFSTKDTKEFDLLLENFVNKFSKYVKDYLTLRIVEDGFMGIDLLLEKNERNNLIVKEHKWSSFQKEFRQVKNNDDLIKIDEKDRKILKLISLNARIPINEISDKIKLAPIAIENRLKKLIREKVIVSMYPLFAISELGYQWYKVFLQIRNINKNEFLAYLKQHANVLWYMKLIGKYNYQFSVFAKNNIEFYNILNEIRSKFSNNIFSYNTLIILNQRKFVHRID